jgi:cytochrome c peroxidase
MSAQTRLAALLLAVGTVAATGARSLAQDHRREPAPTAVHLVGHEDAALLERVQDVHDNWDRRKLRNPYVDTLSPADAEAKPPRPARKSPRRRDLNDFIADFDAAEALGKALFWEMRAGSDFRREGGKAVGTACASCHYRHGADARNTHTTRVPFVAWDRYERDPLHPDLGFNLAPQSYPVADRARQAITSLESLYMPRGRLPRDPRDPEEDEEEDDGPRPHRTSLALVVGSQGVEPRVFLGLETDPGPGKDWVSERSERKKLEGRMFNLPEWSMFVEGQTDAGRLFRQITTRNSPSVVNATFAERLFHDGRAESTFNGFSIFGDADDRAVLHVSPRPGDKPKPIRIALAHASLASQAVGPAVNDVEMSYAGRTFHDLGKKLLGAEVLGDQAIADTDSQLGVYKKLGLVGPGSSYRKLIERAFRREWWDDSDGKNGHYEVPLLLYEDDGPVRTGSLMEANFSLYWGLSLLLYQASLVSNDSPFDRMMSGDGSTVETLWVQKRAQLEPIYIDRVRTEHPERGGLAQFEFKSGSEVFQRGFRVFLGRGGCFECHSVPLMSEAYERQDFAEPGPPIAATLEHTLLTNSRGEAIAIAHKAALDRTVGVVAGRLADSTSDPLVKRQAARVARSLESLLEPAWGREPALVALMNSRFSAPGFPFPTASASAVALDWMTYEKTLVQSSGNRTFFGEDERIAHIPVVLDPVLVESMAIPPEEARHRRPLPIRGPLANDLQAFYDAGFYNIGVTPPRLDPGNGGWVDPYAAQTPEGLDGDGAAAVVALAPAPAPAADPGGAALAAAPPGGGDTRAVPTSDDDRRRAAAGIPGQAYQLRRARRPAATIDLRRPQAPEALRQAPAAAPPAAVAAPAAAPGVRTRLIRDLSWFRDLPRWDRDFPAHPDPLFEYWSIDTRRSLVHFFSHARELAQDESATGYRKPLIHDNELAFWGAFKTPSLRNVELTGPYMHDGRVLSLLDVVDFYDRGGDVPADRVLNPDKHPAIHPLDLDEDDKFALVFFLMCLTDERVRREQGPFDHPGLTIVNGYDDAFGERTFCLEAVGACGHEPACNCFPSSQ